MMSSRLTGDRLSRIMQCGAREGWNSYNGGKGTSMVLVMYHAEDSVAS